MKVFNKIKTFIDERELNVISIVVVILFVVTIIALFVGFSSSLLNKGGAQLYIDSNGVKYLEINKGQYLREKLVINSGDKLPSISDYFLDMAKIDEDDFSINYYSDGVNGTPLTNFTYEKDGVKYIKGTGEITIVLNSKGNEYETKLYIKDEEKPEVILKPVVVDEGTVINKYDFIAIYSDNSMSSDYTVDYKDNVQYTEPGIYNVGLVVCDSSKNCFEGNGELTIISKVTNSSSKPSQSKKGGSSSNKSSSSKSGSSSSKKKSPSSSSNSSQTNSNSGSSKKLKDPVKVIKIDKSRTATVEKDINCKASGDTTGAYVVHSSTTEGVVLRTINHFGTTESVRGDVTEYNYSNDAVRCEVVEYSTRYWDFSKFNGSTSEIYSQAVGLIASNKTLSNNVLSLVNNYRQNNNVGTLSNAEILNAMAATRALEILYYGNHEKGISSHIRPNGLGISDLFLGIYPLYHDGTITGTSNLAENVYVYDYRDNNSLKAEYAFNAWINSSGHRKNILNKNYKYHGLARVEYRDGRGARVLIWVEILSQYK